MRLRLFQNLKEVAMESNSSVVAPIPISLLEGLGVLDQDTPLGGFSRIRHRDCTGRDQPGDQH